MNWLRKMLTSACDYLFELIFPTVAELPGLAYLLKNVILDQYLELAVEINEPTDRTYQITALVELTIKPWDSLRSLRDKLMPNLELPYATG